MRFKSFKNLFLLFLLLLVFNCSGNLSRDLAMASLLTEVVDSDSKSDDESDEKVVTDKSNYTLGQDLSSKADVRLTESEKTVSLEKLGEKYVSDRILLKDLDSGTKFQILSNLDLDFEAYLGVSSLEDQADKQERFQDLSSKSSSVFRITQEGKKYVLKLLTENNYSLFLVSDSEQEVKIKKLSEDKSSEKDKTVPSEGIDITGNDRVKMIQSEFLSGSDGLFEYRTPQLMYDVKRGDKIFSSLISPKKYRYHYRGAWYSGNSFFKDKDDMKSRKLRDFPTISTFSFTFPGATIQRTGAYSNMIYTLLEDKVDIVEYKMVKISPYIPKADASITTIDANFKSIDYILDDRNKVVQTYTSNQFTLTGVQRGTVLVIQMHPTKDWKELKDSDFYEFIFYKGTGRLTKDNIRDRYVPSYKVIDSRKSKKERISLYGSGDYSIVFTNYSNEKKTEHKIKVDR